MAESPTEGDTPPDAPTSPRFPEYERAVTQLFAHLVNELMVAKDQVLGQMQRTTSTELASLSAPANVAYGSMRPLELGFECVQPFDAVESVDTDEWASMVDKAATDAVNQLMPQIFAHMSAICDEAGQTIDAGGKPLSIDLILDMLEKMRIDFDESGAPQMPTMVVHPSAAEKLAQLPPQTPAQLERHKKIMESKKREFDASRRVRKLD